MRYSPVSPVAKTTLSKTFQEFEAEDFRALFSFSQEEAASKCGVCLSVFKHKFHSLRPRLRWPTKNTREIYKAKHDLSALVQEYDSLYKLYLQNAKMVEEMKKRVNTHKYGSPQLQTSTPAASASQLPSITRLLSAVENTLPTDNSSPQSTQSREKSYDSCASSQSSPHLSPVKTTIGHCSSKNMSQLGLNCDSAHMYSNCNSACQPAPRISSSGPALSTNFYTYSS